jgi:hypothetical protein
LAAGPVVHREPEISAELSGPVIPDAGPVSAFFGPQNLGAVVQPSTSVSPLLCPMCDGQMQLLAFIIADTEIRKILAHIWVHSEPPHAGHRCWMTVTVMRRWVRVSKSRRIGIWRHNPHPTLMLISASTGD